MSSPNVPDPYIALGVPKDATSQQIKTTYRKAALKFHPDKVTDESLKAEAADNFHRIQQAYEILGDEDRRGRYDAQVRLAELRKEMIERQAKSPKVDVRVATAAFEIPTQTPGRSTFTARGPERMTEERRPAKSSDDSDYFGDQVRASSRKHSDYDRESRKYSSKGEGERVKVYPREKETEKSSRSDKRRVSDKDRRREREKKYQYVEDDTDSEVENFVRPRFREEDHDKEYYKRHKDQDPYEYGRDPDREYSSGTRKMSFQADDARDYIRRASSQRPPLVKTSSSRDDYSDRYRSSERPPVMVRRSSARPSSSRDEKKRDKDRERKYSAPDILEDLDDSPSRSRAPPLEKHYTSPEIKLSQESRRSQTTNAKYDNTEFEASTPKIKRAETMPAMHSSSRRKESTPYTSSKLRNTEMNEGLPTPSSTPEYQSPVETPQSATKYRVAEEPVGLSSSGRRTVKREPDSSRETRRVTRSPSPIDRDRKTRPSGNRQASMPHITPLRTSNLHNYSPLQTESPISMEARRRPSPVSRHSERNPLFNEITEVQSPTAATPTSAGRKTVHRYPDPGSARDRERYRSSLEAEDIRSPVLDSVRMASGGRRSSRQSERPSLSRHASVY